MDGVMETTERKSWKNLGGGLRVYLPSKTIYAVKAFRYLGIPNLYECLGQISEREARRKLPEVIEEWKQKNLDKESAKTIGDLIPDFLKYETPKKRRKRTIDNHKLAFADIDKYLGDILWSDFGEEIYFDRLEEVKRDKARIAEERRKNRKGGAQRKTFDYLAVAMNMLSKYAYKKKMISHHVKIPLLDELGRVGRAIDHQTAQDLYSHMTEDAKDMYCLSYVNCMRKDEGMLLTWERFDLKTGLITLRPEDVKTGSRTKRGRQIIVADWVRERFIARYEQQKLLNSPWVFPSPRNPMNPQRSIKTAWKGAKRRAGITGRLRWHDLRHSGISYLIHVCKLDIVKVSEFVGTSVRTLQRVYLHTRPEHTKEVGQAIRLE